MWRRNNREEIAWGIKIEISGREEGNEGTFNT